jgi:hypothetical protein
MSATDLIRDLQSLVEQHGDLPVTLAISTYEYAVGSTGHAGSGPLPNLGQLQRQADLPERIVFEGRMQG